MHLLSGAPDVAISPEGMTSTASKTPIHSSAAEIELLRQDVTALRQELEKIKKHLGMSAE